MFRINPACIWQVLIVFSVCPSHVSGEEIDDLVKTGKILINDYADHLLIKYNQAYESGKTSAISDVCKKNAGPVTLNGWQIKRISLTNLDKNNFPDPVETRILEDFNRRKNEGWNIQRLAYYRQDETEKSRQFRYFKAFQYDERCMACHNKKEENGLMKSGLGAYVIGKIINQPASNTAQSHRESSLPAYDESGNSLR